jgi:hypothetical protein
MARTRQEAQHIRRANVTSEYLPPSIRIPRFSCRLANPALQIHETRPPRRKRPLRQRRQRRKRHLLAVLHQTRLRRRHHPSRHKGRLLPPGSEVSCPYVTAVGATQVNPGASVHDPESATDFSGGGFSNRFSMPEYQKAAVTSYLSHAKLPFNSTLFNSAGRAYPDISANGNNIGVIINGTVNSVGGTSASSPIVASLFTLINNQLLAAGKPVIGFANPVLYAHPEAIVGNHK